MDYKFLVFFIVLNIFNVVISTIKSLLTVNGNKWVASLSNGVNFFVNTYVVIYMIAPNLSTFEKATIVGLCNLVGVFIVKSIEEKFSKDKLWIFNCTAKEEIASVNKIVKSLKDMDIKLVYNQLSDNLFTLTIYSYRNKESKIIISILDNYNVKYCVTEAKVI